MSLRSHPPAFASDATAAFAFAFATRMSSDRSGDVNSSYGGGVSGAHPKRDGDRGGDVNSSDVVGGVGGSAGRKSGGKQGVEVGEEEEEAATRLTSSKDSSRSFQPIARWHVALGTLGNQSRRIVSHGPDHFRRRG